METAAHIQLKRLAAAYLLRHGCQAVAMEVRCSIGRYRADVAGWIDASSLGSKVNHFRRWADPQTELPFMDAGRDKVRERVPPRTIIIECKQSRADFQRDAELRETLQRKREHVENRLRKLEETIVKAREPELRSEGTFLFDELETWDFSRSKVKGYQLARVELERVDEKLRHSTKFWSLARYGLADHLYVMAPAGLITKQEVPPGWGLLECPARWKSLSKLSLLELSDQSVRVAVEAPARNVKSAWRERLLRNMAVALTRQAVLGLGIADHSRRYSHPAATAVQE